MGWLFSPSHRHVLRHSTIVWANDGVPDLNRGRLAANASQAASLVAHLALHVRFLYQRFLFDGMAAMIGPASVFGRDEVLLMSSVRVHLLS
jgi:hypothetical protein